MKRMTLAETIAALDGACDRTEAMGSVTGVTTDSRAAKAGDLFVAIRGERFDGHDFVGEAFHRGAIGAVVRRDYEPPRPVGRSTYETTHIRPTRRSAATAPDGRSAATAEDVPADAVLVRVDDTLAALGRLGRYYRRSIIGGSATVIAVTGSNGKTTTKTMIAHVLGARLKGRASIKSYNNAIGVPLTLLASEPGDDFVVCEVGTNAPGEIDALARLIEPDIAVITGVSPAHLERLGSIERIVVEKTSLLYHVRSEGCALVNADHELLRRAVEANPEFAKLRRVTFGTWAGADLRLTDLRVEPCAPEREQAVFSPLALEMSVNERFRYRLNVCGRHNAWNALAAIGVARRLGLEHEEIAARLDTFRLPDMRLQCERIGRLTLINDAYNANPASLAAALEVLSEVPAPGRRVLIVGEMRELGPASAALLREAAECIAAGGVDVVVAVGEHAKTTGRIVQERSGGAIETHVYATTPLAKRRLTMHLRADDTILVKGSRALKLEALAEAIRGWAEKRIENGELRIEKASLA